MRSRFTFLALAAATAAAASACSDVAGPKQQTDRATALSQGAPASVSVDPMTDTVALGDTVQLAATAYDASRNPITGVTFLWGLNDTSVARVSASGRFIGKKTGTVSVVAIAGTVYGKGIVVVKSSASGTTTAPSTSTATDSVAAGSLFSDYNPVSSHWSHIRTMMTDFYYGWTSTERAWAAAHYDYAMSGSESAWKADNASVGHIPYALEWTMLVPGQQHDDIYNTYYHDMQSWYATHTQYHLEDAFLHVAGAATRDSATRAVVSIWGSHRWMVNPADPGLRAYQVDRFQRITSTEDGVFIDESGSGDIAARVRNVAEYPTLDAYKTAHTSMLAAIKQGVGSKMVMINTAEWMTDWDHADILAAGAVHLENVNNPLYSGMPSRWRWIDDLLSNNVFVDLVPLYSSEYMDTHPSLYPADGYYATSSQRLKMYELASYYMTVGSSPANYALQLENTWDKPYSSLWLKAQEANVGHPTSARSTYRTGTDPVGHGYTVYSRDFDRALVLVRAQSGWYTQSYGGETAVTVPLPSGEQWLLLRADGTLSAPVTSVTLRNSEAVILIKKSTIN